MLTDLSVTKKPGQLHNPRRSWELYRSVFFSLDGGVLLRALPQIQRNSGTNFICCRLSADFRFFHGTLTKSTTIGHPSNVAAPSRCIKNIYIYSCLLLIWLLQESFFCSLITKKSSRLAAREAWRRAKTEEARRGGMSQVELQNFVAWHGWSDLGGMSWAEWVGWRGFNRDSSLGVMGWMEWRQWSELGIKLVYRVI